MVVGGGRVAERKARRLLSCGAKVILVSPRVTLRLAELGAGGGAGKRLGGIILRRRKVGLRDLSGARLVIVATADRELNRRVSDYCHSRGILVNVVDSPQECSFILPAVVCRGDLVIGISTSGASPAMAKKIRQDLERRFGREYGSLLRRMRKLRKIGVISV